MSQQNVETDIVFQSNDSDSNIKIADFGFAKKAESDHCLHTQCGTPGYVAPEILEGTPYGTQVDMWSLGVIVVRQSHFGCFYA